MESANADQEQIQKRLAEYEAAWKNGSVEDLMAFMADDVSISDFGPSPPFLILPPSPL
jgi:ketosteroid isomerase-like protein